MKQSSLQHTCDRSEQNGRKTKTELVRSFVPVVDSMATVGGKRAATVREVVAKSIGVELKTTQALEIVKAGRKVPATVAVNEYRFIETYIEKLAHKDARGTYKFGQEMGDDGLMFQYAYIATSRKCGGVFTASIPLWRRQRNGNGSQWAPVPSGAPHHALFETGGQSQTH